MGMKVTDTFDEEEKEEGMDWKCGILRCMGPPSTTARDCVQHLEFCLPPSGRSFPTYHFYIQAAWTNRIQRSGSDALEENAHHSLSISVYPTNCGHVGAPFPFAATRRVAPQGSILAKP